MKKILVSVSIIAAVAAVVVGATTAFFSDTETSSGNTFTAGSLDLKVDNNCTYNDEACPEPTDIETTWEQTDLGVAHKFFYFTDVKPGDDGEDTISLHVDNDAWLRLVIDGVVNNDVSCTEPEGVAEGDSDCSITEGEPAGELQPNVLFIMWLDQGIIPGFQGQGQDSYECDNELGDEPIIISEGPIDVGGETWELEDWQGAYLNAGETACFGVSWRVPIDVDNKIQSDSFVGNMTFDVEQVRNNPTPSWDD